MELKGIAAAPGIAVAKCVFLEPIIIGDYTNELSISGDSSLKALSIATEIASVQITNITKRAEEEGLTERAEIMEAHLMMLQDPMLHEAFEAKINSGASEKAAVQWVIENQAQAFEALDDEYFRERALDIRDIGRRLMMLLIGIEDVDLSHLEEESIIVAHDITPSQMASLDSQKVKGIVTQIGGKTSHVAIMAKNMEIPAVLGVKGVELLKEKTFLSINGSKGTVEADLTDERIAEIKILIQERQVFKKGLEQIKDQETKTKDGTKIELCANIIDVHGVDKANEVGAEGIGLYRTEFLFMDRDSVPTEEEQFKAYYQVVSKMQGKPVIIRTMDIGGDKEVACLGLKKEENPFLGYRAIRICLDDQELFKTQLRAILRASAFGKALIMYPMISSLEEIEAADSILSVAKQELRERNMAFDENISVGIMIEIPAAAVVAQQLIKRVDFFSIGTNDLTQYTLAVDRMNDKISHMYNHFKPGVIHLIKMVIEATKIYPKKFTGMCGEMASDPYATLLLVGLGLDEFSVNPSELLKIKKIISLIDKKEAEQIATAILEMEYCSEIEQNLKNHLNELVGENFLKLS